MAKKNKLTGEFVHVAIMSLLFIEHGLLKDLEFKGKKMSRKTKYNTIISLLEKGALTIVYLGDDKLTFMPVRDKEAWVHHPIIREKLEGTYEEAEELLTKMREAGYEN